MMSYLKMENIEKIYDEGNQAEALHAIKKANFSIAEGELVIFVGPSGCGKSTFLRMVAGLEDISEGKMILDNKELNDIEPKSRDIAMVFQDYALYPHMTVKENLSFGLENQKMAKSKIKEKVTTVLDILELSNLENRFPSQLSGGQRQRVALGRAMVKEPKVFLLDEPLSNLDAKLRVQTRRLVAKLHKKLHATMIYVTHDQIEAMTLGDKIVVMNAGEVQQIDTPEKIYLEPENVFVATFIGTPPMNIIPGIVTSSRTVELGSEVTLTLPKECDETFMERYRNKEVLVGIRPEDIGLTTDTQQTMSKPYQPIFVEFLGSENLVYFNIFGEEIVSKISTPYKLSEKEHYYLDFSNSRIYLFDKGSEKRIRQ